MMKATVFVGRKDIIRYYGVTKEYLEKVIAAGVLHRVRLPGGKYGKFLRAEVDRMFKKVIKEDV